jgi:hypothetical protein
MFWFERKMEQVTVEIGTEVFKQKDELIFSFGLSYQFRSERCFLFLLQYRYYLPRFYYMCSRVWATYTNVVYEFLFAKGMIASACARLSAFFWLLFATAYSNPAKNPTPIADTDPNVTASPKNISPDAATGSLFKAPTMLTTHAISSWIA